MKRTISILLIAVMLIGLLSVASAGASASAYVTTARQKTYYFEGKGFTYRIPKINLSGSDAADVNAKIYKDYNDCFTKNPLEAYPGNNTGLDYASYLNGDVLSVVITQVYPYNQFITYDVYNFNVKTGKRLYNKDILALKGITDTAARKNVIALLRNEFKSVLNNSSSGAIAQKALDRSTSESNLNDNLYFLGNNGKLMAKYTIYWIAGSGRYYRTKELNAYAATPSGVKAQNINAGIRLTWSKSAGAAKYRVFAKTASGWKKAGDVTDPVFTYKTTASGKKYTFTVRAMDKNSNYISGYHTTGFTYTFLAAPEISTLTNTSKGVVIRWNPVPGAKNYRLFIKTASGWRKVGDTSGTRWINGAVKNGVRYTYTVRCINAAGTAYVSGYNTVGASIVCKR